MGKNLVTEQKPERRGICRKSKYIPVKLVAKLLPIKGIFVPL
jgi:hypothetical protein